MCMARRRFQLNEIQAKELISAHARSKDGATRTHFQAVRLYGIGYPTQEVIKITGCGRSSLMEWCRKYRTEGIGGLVDKRVGGNHAYQDEDGNYYIMKLDGYTWSGGYVWCRGYAWSD